MIDVTIASFETEVMQASQSVPVLLDFWAPWCGPCKVIGPLLEKLETEYAGRFKLVKIDSDKEQQLAAAFGVRSIPTCVLMVRGQPVDGFMGALPEGQLRTFLDKHVPSAEEVQAELAEEEALDALADGDLASALEKLEQAVATDPANLDARFDYVKLLLQLGQHEAARQAFAPVAAQALSVRRLDSLQRWLQAIDQLAANGLAPGDTAPLDARIASNRRDFEARYQRAQSLLVAQRWTEAMDELLEILMRERGWSDELARKTYVAILDLIEVPKPKVADGQIPPEDPTLASYRRRLSSVVLS